MYEEYTFDFLIERMKQRVINIDSTIDVNEGSLIYNALAPAAWELAQAYISMDVVLNNISLDTASGEYLTSLCNQNGIQRKLATKSLRRGEFDVNVPIGSRFSLNDTTYIVLSKIEDFLFILECEQYGTIGNTYNGILTALEFIEGLSRAILTDILESGTNEETDDNLRERIREYLTIPSQDGNLAQYKLWAQEYEGIGRAKIFPQWNGGNTVKIAITNGLFLPAEMSLVDKFQKYMDPEISGLGNGVAPIGSKVTITGGISKSINITASVVLAEGFVDAEGANEAIRDYLSSIVFLKSSVSYLRIGSTLLDCRSIEELSNLKINDGSVDIQLVDDEIPILSNLDLVVLS